MSYERPDISRMQGYSYGEQIANSSTAPELVKLNTNENAYPPSPSVAKALTEFDTSKLRTYPNALADPFRAAAATLHGLSIGNVMATNGGDEALRLAITTFVDAGAVFGTVTPSYSLYPVLAQVQGCRHLQVPLGPDFRLPQDLPDQLNAAKVRLTCIVNPHAPSGQLVAADEIRDMAERLNGVLLVDEAYVDFVDPKNDHNLTALVADVPNLLLLRSMSKGYALAGLRFGYLLGHAELIRPMLEKTRDSYNVDAIAQALALAALNDQTYARSNWQAIRDDRDKLRIELQVLGFEVPRSQTNFLLAQCSSEHRADAPSLYASLRAQNILVRYFTELPDRLRISVGTPAENNRLIAALVALLDP